MPLIYGHRGARGEVTENTLAGFLHAAALGVAGIETDIAMSADFVPVMHHDPVTADGRVICRTPFAGLADIPTLAASLAALPEMTWLLEIKTFPDRAGLSHAPAVVVRRVLEVLDEASVDLRRIAVKAFDWEVLREVAWRRPELARICLTAPDTEAARDLWWGAAIGAAGTPEAVAELGVSVWSAFHKTLTVERVVLAKRLGLLVLAWTVNEPADYARLAPLVDGIVTDFPSRFLAR